VRDTIKYIADYAKMDKAALEKSIRKMLAAQQTDEIKAQQKRLAVYKARYAELERLMNKIYEDNALGRLPQKRFDSLTQTYGGEQAALEKEIEIIHAAVKKYEGHNGRAERFMKLVERYTDFEEITPIMIREFIEKIVVHSKESQYVQSSPQRVQIHLNFIGELELHNGERELTPEEMAEQERREKEREYNRQRYLKRKASGYYDKPKKEPTKTERSTAELPMAANQ
jgi:hypothetical protein